MTLSGSSVPLISGVRRPFVPAAQATDDARLRLCTAETHGVSVLRAERRPKAFDATAPGMRITADKTSLPFVKHLTDTPRDRGHS